jgi:transcriptional regulator with GAF, ATPase, and Fis domain
MLQAISSEIALDRLIDTFIRLAMQHAGAERAVLLLTRGTEQQIEAEATTCTAGVNVRLRRGNPQLEAALPKSIVHFVTRTRECVILDDALVSEDTYLQDHNTRSILCLPLTNHTTLSGLLYLENMVPSSFNLTGVAVLKLIAWKRDFSGKMARGCLY